MIESADKTEVRLRPDGTRVVVDFYKERVVCEVAYRVERIEAKPEQAFSLAGNPQSNLMYQNHEIRQPLQRVVSVYKILEYAAEPRWSRWKGLFLTLGMIGVVIFFFGLARWFWKGEETFIGIGGGMASVAGFAGSMLQVRRASSYQRGRRLLRMGEEREVGDWKPHGSSLSVSVGPHFPARSVDE